MLPVYNEAAHLETSLAELSGHLQKLPEGYRWHLLVVNDGSTDCTGALAEQFAAGKPNVRVLHHETNRGLSEALRTAFAALKDDFVVTLDADLSYEPAHIGRMLEAAERTGADIVLASPYMPGGRVSNVPWIRRALSRLANAYLAAKLGERLHTFTSLMRVYRREALAWVNGKPAPFDVSFQILAEALRRGAKIVEVPAHLCWRHRSRRATPVRIGHRIREVLRFARQLSHG